MADLTAAIRSTPDCAAEAKRVATTTQLGFVQGIRTSEGDSDGATIQRGNQTKRGRRDNAPFQNASFAPDLTYFSECVLNKKEPEPSGKKGLADVVRAATPSGGK